MITCIDRGTWCWQQLENGRVEKIAIGSSDGGGGGSSSSSSSSSSSGFNGGGSSRVMVVVVIVNFKNYESATSFNNLYDIFRILYLAVNYF